eukprot:3988885-Prymnesium_polylepis.1
MALVYTPTWLLCTPQHGSCVHPNMANCVHTPTWLLCAPQHGNCVRILTWQLRPHRDMAQVGGFECYVNAANEELTAAEVYRADASSEGVTSIHPINNRCAPNSAPKKGRLELPRARGVVDSARVVERARAGDFARAPPPPPPALARGAARIGAARPGSGARWCGTARTRDR